MKTEETERNQAQYLIEMLKILDTNNNNATMLENLNDRKRKELEFHNLNRNEKRIADMDQDTYEKYYGNKKYYKTVNKSRTYVLDWIKTNTPGKVFLDYACGNGELAMVAAEAGAELAIGIDISDVSIDNCRKQAGERKLKNIYFLQADCENTGLPAQCIDLMICSGMLHHLDISYAFPEMRRVLKPGGKILVVEALDYNPLIKLYRERTAEMRTVWEKNHILSYKDLAFANYFFEVKHVNHWHLCSIAGAYLPSVHPALDLLDDFILKIPGIKLLSWIFTFELHRRRDDA